MPNRPVVRSYVHVGDLVDLGFAMMIGDTPTLLEAFDTAGERTIEVGELAKLTASVLGAPGMEIVRPPLDDTPADRYVGDSGAINSLAESYGIRMKHCPVRSRTPPLICGAECRHDVHSTFHGALPVAHSASRRCSSRNVSTGCQNP